MAKIFQKRVEIAGDIQQPHGLVVETELIPGHGLEEFLQGAETAGKRDVGVRQRGEPFLALVDRIDMIEADAVVSHKIREIRRNDPDHFAPGLAGGVRQDPHEPDAGTAVDDADAACGQRPTERLRGARVRRIPAPAGTAHDADAVVSRRTTSHVLPPDPCAKSTFRRPESVGDGHPGGLRRWAAFLGTIRRGRLCSRGVGVAGEHVVVCRSLARWAARWA